MKKILTAEQILQRNIPFYEAIPISDEAHILKSMKEYAIQFFDLLENEFEIDLKVINDVKKLIQ